MDYKYIVYYEENRVLAKMDDLDPVLVREFEAGQDENGRPVSAAQAAHDFVQTVVNPKKFKPEDFGNDSLGRCMGFLHPDFQSQISDNCKALVLAAYDAAKKAA